MATRTITKAEGVADVNSWEYAFKNQADGDVFNVTADLTFVTDNLANGKGSIMWELNTNTTIQTDGPLRVVDFGGMYYLRSNGQAAGTTITIDDLHLKNGEPGKDLVVWITNSGAITATMTDCIVSGADQIGIQVTQQLSTNHALSVALTRVTSSGNGYNGLAVTNSESVNAVDAVVACTDCNFTGNGYSGIIAAQEHGVYISHDGSAGKIIFSASGGRIAGNKGDPIYTDAGSGTIEIPTFSGVKINDVRQVTM